MPYTYTPVVTATRFPPARSCIYCGATDNLSDEHERGRRSRDNLPIEKFQYLVNGRDLARCFRTYVPFPLQTVVSAFDTTNWHIVCFDRLADIK